MNATELAIEMLKWEELKQQLNETEERIVRAVMDIGKTQTVGNVRASYSGGRKSYDYQAAATRLNISEETIGQFTTIPAPRIDWRGICTYVDAKEIPYTMSDPSVSVKMLA